MATGISDAALLRALAEDVPDMAPSVREHLREIASRLAAQPAPEGVSLTDERRCVSDQFCSEVTICPKGKCQRAALAIQGAGDA